MRGSVVIGGWTAVTVGLEGEFEFAMEGDRDRK